MQRGKLAPSIVPLQPADTLPASPPSGFGMGMTSRPIYYTDAVGDEICRRIVYGQTLREIDLDPSMPSLMTVISWTSRYPEFRDRYRQARIDSAHVLEYDILHIAAAAKTKDDAACARIRVQAMQWVAARRNPQVYGERVDINVRSEPARMPLNLRNLSPADIATLRGLVAKSIAANSTAPAPTIIDQSADDAVEILSPGMPQPDDDG